MEKARLILGAGALTASVAFAVLSLLDPTHADTKQLDHIASAAQSAPRLASLTKPASFRSDMDGLVQAPIFVMTTGIGAYTEKTFQLFGVSISGDRKAALVGIDGAAPVWIRMGQLNGDIQLLDVSASSARFDTPVGERTVNLSDAPPAATTPAAAGG
jgi:hypothetical protein